MRRGRGDKNRYVTAASPTEMTGNMLFGILRDRQMAGRPPFESYPPAASLGVSCRWLSTSRFENPIYQICPARQNLHCRPYVALTSASPRHFDQ